jgi:hypothetical protein
MFDNFLNNEPNLNDEHQEEQQHKMIQTILMKILMKYQQQKIFMITRINMLMNKINQQSPIPFQFDFTNVTG